jgi:hypothetical protein
MTLAAVIFFIAAVCKTGDAENPSKCERTRDKQAYDVGYSKGKNIVEQAWKSIKQDCKKSQRREAFNLKIEKILSSMKLHDNATSYVKCHYYGYKAGAIEKLKSIEKICSKE